MVLGLRPLPSHHSPSDAAYLRGLGPVEGAGSVARVFAVDLVAVHADDHFSTPREKGAMGQYRRPWGWREVAWGWRRP